MSADHAHAGRPARAPQEPPRAYTLAMAASFSPRQRWRFAAASCAGGAPIIITAGPCAVPLAGLRYPQMARGFGPPLCAGRSGYAASNHPRPGTPPPNCDCGRDPECHEEDLFQIFCCHCPITKSCASRKTRARCLEERLHLALELGLGLGLGLDLHFAVWVSGLHSTFDQLLAVTACGDREKGDAIFDLVPLDEALRWSLRCENI